MTSITALYRHWLRTTYMSNLWSNVTQNNVYVSLPLPEESGWILSNEEYSIDWEDTKKQDEIIQSIDLVLHQCKCIKGCATAICGCQKKGSYCGPGCYCTDCTDYQNILTKGSNIDDIGADSSESDTDTEELETEIVTDTDYFIDDHLIC